MERALQLVVVNVNDNGQLATDSESAEHALRFVVVHCQLSIAQRYFVANPTGTFPSASSASSSISTVTTCAAGGPVCSHWMSM